MVSRERSRILHSITSFIFSCITCSSLPAQTPPPETYTIVMKTSAVVENQTIKTYRDGSKVLQDTSIPPSKDNPKAYHSRSLIDLQAGTMYTWDVIKTGAPCSMETFSGDWADPFQSAKNWASGSAGQKHEVLGKAVINGFSTTIYRATLPDSGPSKVWIDEKYGLPVRIETTGDNGRPEVVSEFTSLSLEKPPATLFVLPAECKNAQNMGHAHTEGGKTEAVIEPFGTAPKPGTGGGKSGFVLCEDALALYREFKSRGIEMRNRSSVGNRLWVVPLADPDGYRIEFSSPTDAPEETELEE